MFKVPERKIASSYRNYKSPTIGLPIVESQSALWRTTYLPKKSPPPVRRNDDARGTSSEAAADGCDDSVTSTGSVTAVPVSHEHRVISGPHLGKLAFSESMTIHPKDPNKFRLKAEEAYLMSDRDRVQLPSLIVKTFSGERERAGRLGRDQPLT